MSVRYTPEHCAIIILNYCNAKDTIACLHALSKMLVQPHTIIVVDNNSIDNSVEDILDTWSTFSDPALLQYCDSTISADNIHHIVYTRISNDGFSAGNNDAIDLALQHTDCTAVWILNNDTIPAADALHALCRRMNASDMPGIVGSTLLYEHDRQTVQTLAGGRLNTLLGTTTSFGGGSLLAEALRRFSPSRIDHDLDDITGASMFIRREVLEKVRFDKAFFLYGEETEFCIRARKAGFTLAWAPESIVYHKEGGSTGARSMARGRTFHRPAWVDYLALRNRVYTMRKHYPWALPIVLLSYAGVMVKRIWRGQARRIPMVCRAAWDGLCGRMGRPDHLFPQLRGRHENSCH